MKRLQIEHNEVEKKNQLVGHCTSHREVSFYPFIVMFNKLALITMMSKVLKLFPEFARKSEVAS